MENQIIKSRLVLVIDDDIDHLFLISTKLKKMGYQVLISHNANNMLDLIINTPPDIIFLDIHMDGIDGRNVCSLLKCNTSTSQIPVIMLSSNPDLKDVAVKCGANGYIEKGFIGLSIEEEINRVTSLK